MIIILVLVTTNNRSIALLFTIYFYYLILSSAHCLLLLLSIIYKRKEKKNFKSSKSRFSLQLSSWKFKSSQHACAIERKHQDHDNTLHNYIKCLQSDSWNITKQWDNCQNSNLQESKNKHECYCWSFKILHELQRMFNLRLQELENKEYVIIRI